MNNVPTSKLKCAVTAALICVTACMAGARTLTWVGDGFTDLWSDSDNWSPSFAPVDGDTLIFDGNAFSDNNNNDFANLRVASLQFTGPGSFSLFGNPIRVDTDIVANNTSGFGRVLMGVTFTSGGGTLYTLNNGQLEVRGTITLANSQQLIAYAFTTNITISGAIVGDGDLVKLGVGSLFITGNPANTYSGSTLIRQGRVHLAKPSLAQAISANVFIGDIGNSSSLFDDLGGQYPPAMSMFIGDRGFWGITNGATVTNLTIYSPGDIGGTGLLTLGCDVEVFHGDDTFVTLSGIGCPIYLGSQTRTFNFNAGPVLGIVEFFVDGPIIGPGPGPGSPGIIQSSFGEMYLEGPNLYFGPTTIESGRLWAENATALGGSGAGAETWVEGGSLVLYGFAMPVAEPIFMTGGDLEFAGDVTLSGALVLSNNCSLRGLDNASLLNISSVISGPDDFTVSGGIVRLSGSSPNTFGGGSAFSRVFVQPDSFNGPSTATLELAKSGITALPVPVTVSAFTTNIAILRQAQTGGVSDVTIGHNGSWQLNGRSVTPAALKFTGDGYVDSQGGLLQFTNPDTNQLQVVPGSPANYTAHIFGLLSCAASTNNFVIQSNLTLNVAAQISGGLIRKRGAGTLMLSSFNSFGGQLLVQEGLLFANANNCLGTPFSSTIVSNGATLLLNGTNMTWCGEPLTIEGDGIGGTNGALTSNLGCVITNGIFLAAPASINTPSNCLIEVQTAITGTGPLTKIGPGIVYYSGGQPNAYAGDTLVNRGTLWLGKPSGTTAVPGHLVVGAGTFNSPAQVWQFSSFAILGSVTVNRGGLWDLFGQAEGFTVSLLEGRPPLTLNEGGDVQTGAAGFIYLPVGGDIAVNPGTLPNASSFITGNIGLDPGPHNFNIGPGFQTFGGGPECDITAAISQTGAAADLVKGGSGVLRLAGNNSFTGQTIVNAGPLLVGSALALGSTASGTVVNSNGTLRLSGGLVVADEALTLNGTGLPLDSFAGSNTWTGPIVLSRDSAVAVGSGGYLQVPNVASGPGGLTKMDAGTLQFSGALSNSYGGLTVVSNGMIDCTRPGGVAIPGDSIIGNDPPGSPTATLRSSHVLQLKQYSSVTVRKSGVLDLFHVNSVPGQIERVRSVTGDGSVLIGLGSRLIISNAVPFEFRGTMNGTGSVTKNGPGSMTAWGDWTLSPFGALDIFAGDMIIHISIDTDTNSVRVGGRMRGDGRALAQVGVSAGGALAVDSKVPGKLGGDLEMNGLFLTASSSTAVAWDLYGPTSNGGNDRFIVNGTVRMSGNVFNLAVNFQYPPREGDVITLLEKTTAGAITGNFGGILAPGVRKIGDYSVIVSYTGGDGNDLTLTVTNLALDYFSYALAEGNGNQTVEPDECNLLYVSLLNSRTNAVTITNALLRATTSNAVVTIAQASYPVIAPGNVAANLTPFQFRTDPAMLCGGAVEFELVLGVAGEGRFAVVFSPVSGLDCTHPTGPCESCLVASGQFSTNTPATSQPLNFAGAPSICFPPKPCPGIAADTNTPLRYLTQSFTNSTTNGLCVTAQLKFDCPGAPTNALGAAAYLGSFDPAQPCANYLGDSGEASTAEYPPFSFNVPAGSNVVMVVMARATNLVCDTYALELFGLPCPPPTLAIAREAAPQKVRVHWSTAYPDYSAQQAGRVQGTYGDVAQPPAIIGGRYALTNITTITNQFYRLIKP